MRSDMRFWLEWRFLSMLYILVFEPPHDKTNKMACAPSKNSDQSGHPPNLISLRCSPEESFDP